MKFRLASLFAMAFAAVAAQAADKFWTAQGTTANWSEGANWSNGSAPVAGDRIFFTVGAESVNDLGSTPFDSLGVLIGAAHTFDGAPIVLTGATPIVVQPGATATFDAGVKLAGGRVNVAGLGRTKMLGAITSDGACTMALDMRDALVAADNQCEIESTTQTLAVRSGASLGPSRVTITNGTLVVGDPALAGIFVSNPISMRGLTRPATIQAFASSGSVDFVAPIDMDGDIRLVSAADTNVRSSIGGLGKLTITVADRTSVMLSGPVTPHGGLDLAHGLVRVAASDALHADDLTIDSGAKLSLDGFIKAVATLRCTGNLQIAPGAGLLLVNQPSSVDGCILDLTTPSRFTVPAGGEVTLIKNNSGAALGTFAGLPEGAALSDAFGDRASITYRGGSGHDVSLVAAGPVTSPSVQDMWWSGSIENGWGMSLVQHGDALFAALYIYDASGKPTWLVMPGGSWNDAKTVFTGALFSPHGTPYFAYDAQQLAVGGAVGNAALTFQDPAHATLDYTIGGVSGRKLITREVFATGAQTRADRSDLWWGGAAQNGWGVTLLQQADTIFGVWYTYDASGAPTWYVLPVGAWTSASTYEGRLYRTTGSPWVGSDYDGSRLQAADVGSYRITFVGGTATFQFEADGKSGTLALQRQPF